MRRPQYGKKTLTNAEIMKIYIPSSFRCSAAMVYVRVVVLWMLMFSRGRDAATK